MLETQRVFQFTFAINIKGGVKMLNEQILYLSTAMLSYLIKFANFFCN